MKESQYYDKAVAQVFKRWDKGIQVRIRQKRNRILTIK